VGGTVAADVSPLTIFPTGNLLWLEAFGGTHLRDSGGAAPSDGEAVVAAVDLGNVGDCTTSGAGVTYSAAAFGGRGGLAFAAGANDWLLSPSWVLASRCSGIAVFNIPSGTRGAWGHGAVNTRMMLLWGPSAIKARRIDGAAGLQTEVAAAASTDFWSSFLMDDTITEIWGMGGLTGVPVTGASSIPGTAATTGIGAASNTGTIPWLGTLGLLVLWDGVMDDTQRGQLEAYAQSVSGLGA
jgi:hypothetical protein